MTYTAVKTNSSQSSYRKRLLSGATAALMAFGAIVGFAAPAVAAPPSLEAAYVDSEGDGGVTLLYTAFLDTGTKDISKFTLTVNGTARTIADYTVVNKTVNISLALGEKIIFSDSNIKLNFDNSGATINNAGVPVDSFVNKPVINNLVGVSSTTATGTTLNFTPDRAGTYFYAVYDAATPAPDVENIKNPDTADAQGTGPATAAAMTAQITGLVGSTSYKIYLVIEYDDLSTSPVVEIAFRTRLDTTPPTVVGLDTVLVEAGSNAVGTYASEPGVTWAVEGTYSAYFDISTEGVVTFKLPYDVGLNVTFDVVATAAGKNPGRKSVTVTITDTTAPVIISGEGADVPTTSAATWTAPLATATDNSGEVITVVIEYSTADGDGSVFENRASARSYLATAGNTVTVTYSAEDSTGNDETATAVFTAVAASDPLAAAETAVAAYEAGTGTKAAADTAVALVTNSTAKTGFETRITTKAAELAAAAETAAQAAAETAAQAAAETAVAAYVAGTGTKAAADTAVALVTNSTAKTGFETRITTKAAALVAAAITAIEAYTTGATALTVDQLVAAGVTGTVAGNLAAYNTAIGDAAVGAADTLPEIQAIVNAVNAAATPAPTPPSSGGGTIAESPVKAPVATPVSTPLEKPTAAFGVNSAKLSKELRASIRATLDSKIDAKSATCRAFVASKTASAAESKLARDRSRAVCNFITKSNPNLDVQVVKTNLVAKNANQLRKVRLVLR